MLEGMGWIHYEIPDDLHRRAKSAAALRDLTLKDFVIASLEAAVAEPGDQDGARRRRPRS